MSVFFFGVGWFNARPRDRWQIFLPLDILLLSSIFSCFEDESSETIVLMIWLVSGY